MTFSVHGGLGNIGLSNGFNLHQSFMCALEPNGTFDQTALCLQSDVAKTPTRKVKGYFTTGHANSPAPIVIGKAHTRVLKMAGQAPKVMLNYPVKQDCNLNESFTGELCVQSFTHIQQEIKNFHFYIVTNHNV